MRRREHIDLLWASLLACFLMFCAGCRHTKPTYAQYPPVNPVKPRPANGGSLKSVTLSNRFDPAWLQPSSELFTLGPGDRVEIELMGEPASRAVTVVAPDGKIYFDLLPGVDVWGLTLAQARERLESEFSKLVRERPQISLVLRAVESKRFWILGRVTAPGVYPLSEPMTLLEAISVAGGPMTLTSYRDQEAAGINEELADLGHSFVLRQGKLMPIDFKRLLRGGDLSQNIYLQPDDFIYLPASRAREVYVLGAVTQAKAVPYVEGLTTAAAIANAYGTLKDAYLTHIGVVRGSLTQPEIAIVNYRQVIRGEAKDIALQPGDIVYVPFSPYRYITRYVELIVNTFASSAAINAGTLAVGATHIGGTGVFIPVGSGLQVIPPASPPPIH